MNESQRGNSLKLDVQRLTALWGFSEAALGGILHMLKVPLTGLLIGGAAVFFISLIARHAESPSQILKSTLVVILIKAVVTPFIPLNSYFAVSVQGVLGYLFFRFIPSYKLSAILLGMVTLSFSAFQKLFIITFMFGNAFWESIDSFVKFILAQLPFLKHVHTPSASLILISVYAAIHILGGLYVGIKVAGIDKWLEKKRSFFDLEAIKNVSTNPLFEQRKSSKKRRWWQRKSGIILLTFSLILVILSYIFPQLGKSTSTNIFFMIIRSLVITLIWFKIISPFILKYFKKFIEKRKFEHASEVNRMTSQFPLFKKVVNYCWNQSSEQSGFKRVYRFLSNSLALLLIIDLTNEQD